MPNANHTNRLARESSPYLLQHAHNPVDWHPWGDEAFALARSLDKPVFLSVGYATCHWCHVMAHESFEHEATAKLLNEAFICVKVDREERPDIDNLYMTACHLLTGQGGWPLTVLLTPGKRPFFAATYMPRESRFGVLGLTDFIPRVADLWTNRREDVLASADTVMEHLRQHAAPEKPLHAQALQGTGASKHNRATLSAILAKAGRELTERYDKRFGGFGTAPKFPSPHTFCFLLRQAERTGDANLTAMVEETLLAMRRGGIWDHLGGGFHRYSTDRLWLLPHFEKMLYDQAMLVLALVETYQATGKAAYRETAEATITYVLRDLLDEGGAFHAAEDADSEGEEGTFYVFGYEEIRELMPPDLKDEFHLVAALFGLQPDGNFEDEATRKKTGANILHHPARLDAIGRDHGVTAERLQAIAERVRPLLLTHRATRIRPQKDDKVLTDWNGLMLAALAKAARAFDRPEYLAAAVRAAEFLLTTLRDPSGNLLHRYRAGVAGVPAMLDDYAFLAWGLTELYQASFTPRYLTEALALTETMLARFTDPEEGTLFIAPQTEETPDLPVRTKEPLDMAAPSGNSVAFTTLLALSCLTGRTELEERAQSLLAGLLPRVSEHPTAYCHLLTGIDFALGPGQTVVLSLPENSADEDLAPLSRVLNQNFHPRAVVLRKDQALDRTAPYAQTMTATLARPTARVCVNFSCKTPVHAPEDFAALLEGQEVSASRGKDTDLPPPIVT